MDNRKITLIKPSGGRAEINWDELVNEKDIISFSFISFEQPLDSFFDAVSVLRKYVLMICEMDASEENIEKIKIKSIKINHLNDANFTVSFCANLEVDSSRSPVTINTPSLLAIACKEDDYILPGNCAWDIENLMLEAKRYIDGERKEAEQQSLFGVKNV